MTPRVATIAIVVLLVSIGVILARDSKPRATETPGKQVAATHDELPIPNVSTETDFGIHGRIEGPAGTGVSAANVCARARSSQGGFARVTCTVTESSGAYELDLASAGRYTISAFATGFASEADSEGPRTVELDVSSPRSELTLRLQPAIPIRGVVRDIFGGTISEAMVVALQQGRQAQFTSGAEDGTFTLWVVDPRTNHLHIEAPGYCARRVAIDRSLTTVEVFLDPEAIIAGIAVDALSRTAVAGATVYGGGASNHESVTSAVTDVNGRFRLTGLGSGRYRPFAEDTGKRGTTNESLWVGPGDTVEDVTITLNAAPTVRGIVVTTPDGTPIPGVDIDLFSDDGLTHVAASTTKDGSVIFPSVPTGAYEVQFQTSSAIIPDEAPTLVVGTTSPPEQRWLLERGVQVRGFVRDRRGNGVNDVKIEAQFESPGAGSAGRTTSGPDGSFILAGLRPLGELRLYATHASLSQLDGPKAVRVDQAKDIDGVIVELDAGAKLKVVVRDMVGGPARQAAIYFYHGGSSAAEKRPVDSEGRADFQGLPPGRYLVVAGGMQSSLQAPPLRVENNWAEIELGSGETDELALRYDFRRGAIQGKVVDASGNPQAGAVVVLQSQADVGRMIRMTTTDEGVFAFRDVPDERYDIKAYTERHEYAERQDIDIGASVELEFQELAALCGTLLGVEAKMGEGLRVGLRGQHLNLPAYEKFADPRQPWCIREISPGEVSVTVLVHGKTLNQTVTLEPGKTAVLTFDVRAMPHGQNSPMSPKPWICGPG